MTKTLMLKMHVKILNNLNPNLIFKKSLYGKIILGCQFSRISNIFSFKIIGIIACDRL